MDQSKTKSIMIGERKFSIPFTLTLKKKNSSLTCNKILRFVPGRRAVFSGYWNGRKIVAKIFFKPFRYKQHVRKELKGNDLLTQAHLQTASIIHFEFIKKLKARLLIFEFIDSSIHLEKIFKNAPYLKSDIKYFRSLIQLIGQMHEKGIIHNDLHPNNFLVKDDMIYALDGAAVKRISRSRIKTIPGLKNLSVLLCQVNRISDELLFDLVDVYAKTRDLKNIREATSTLQKFMAKSHQRMTNRYLKKIYRNSTEIISKKSFSSFMLCRRSYYTPEMASFLKNPDTAFHDSGKTILKAGNSATVIRYHIDGNDLVIKRYNMKNRRHALRRAFKKTRADISWRGAHLLMQNRINSSTPIAIMEIRFGPFRNKAYFICEYVKGKNVIDYFQNSKTEDIFKMAQSIIGVFLKFKSLMISHGDMKGTNMIIREGAPVLIDFDSMARHKMKTRFLHAHEKDVNRFLKNWQTNSDILKILKEIHL